MLHICIPTHDEAPTIGVLLWRIRTLFQEYSREYQVVVYDDGSTDATLDVLEPYAKVLPLTLIGSRERRGYGASVDALCRHVVRHTRYPRRDALILMQGDFTDRPEHIPELVKRFEGGADVVVAQHRATEKDPLPIRRLRQLSPWILRPFVRIEGVVDPTSTMRLFRVAVLRDAIRRAGDEPIVREDGWSANVELLLAAIPFARRVEGVELEQRWDVRPRLTRRRTAADALALARFAWRARGRAAVPGSALRAVPPAPSDGAAPPTERVPAERASGERGAPERGTPERGTPERGTPEHVPVVPTTAAVSAIAVATEEAEGDAPRPPRRRRSRSGRRGGAARRAAGDQPPATPDPAGEEP